MGRTDRTKDVEQPTDPGSHSDQPHPHATSGESTAIVGVGASAGGLDAFSELLEHLPACPGFALVLIQHLQPTHTSDLAEILGRRTSMPVIQAEQDMRIEPDHVYVIPPNVEMRVSGVAFEMSPRPTAGTPSLTVDVFLTSLAEQHGSRAIGVILSGSASDGTRGLAAIKAADGIALVQDPDTAAHTGMPDSAIAASVADAVLPIRAIAEELLRLSEHPHVRRPERPPDEESPQLTADDESALVAVLAHVRRSTGLDLTHYKRPTLLRRIGRRMAMRHAMSMAEYASVLERDPSEVTELLSDVLVRVTSFFRDPESFEALKTEAFPSIVARAAGDGPIRIWVPGCATGPEAYSVAIVLLEYLEAVSSNAQVQIFASDLREDDLAFARRGTFPPEIATDVSEERLARFFTPAEGGYQISKTIRDACVFARHDVTNDPPFARLDLVSCRNLLIYLDETLQRRVLSAFHFSLVADGILMLGNSEATGAAPGLFKRTGHKGILVRLPGDTRPLAFGGTSPRLAQPYADAPAGASFEVEREREWSDAQRQLDEMLLDKFAPAAVLVDDRLMVKQIRGDAGEYLRLRPGDATLSLSSMLSVGLASMVDSALAEVRDSGKPAHRDAVRSRSGGGHAAVGIAVIPVATPDQPISYAVLFNEGGTVSRADGEPGGEPTEVEYLRQELEAALERLRILRDGRDAATESLRAANEEIQSSNEELQSMNEELETAKEELQSTNEELTTLNDELQARNVELSQRNDDLNNLLASASISMLLLDRDLTIRRFTAHAADSFNLIAGDVGRRVTDIRWRIAVDDVEKLLMSVIESEQPLEREVTDDSGCWFRMTMRPYLTADGTVDGAVVTLLDIDSLRRSQIALERAALLSVSANRVNTALGPVDGAPPSTRDALRLIGEALGAARAQLVSWREGVWTITTDDTPDEGSELPRTLSPAEADKLGLRSDLGREPVDETPLGRPHHLAIPLFSSEHSLFGALRLEFEDDHGALDELEREFGRRAADAVAMFLEREQRTETLDRLVAERTAALEDAMRDLETASHTKNQFLANMSHELRTPLNSIIGFSTILLDGMAGDLSDEQRRQLEMVLGSGKHLLAIVSDLLDIEVITAGAMPVRASEFRLADVVRSVGELMMPIAVSKGLDLRLPAADSEIALVSDELKARQVLLNLVSNAIKFTDTGHVSVDAWARDGMCTVVVEDTGRGMAPEHLAHAFDEFERGDIDPSRLTEGTGLGLSIASRLARLLGGSVSAESTPDVGFTFTFVLALRVGSKGPPATELPSPQ